MTYSDQFNIRSRFVKFNDVADAIDGLITRQNAPNTTGSNVAYSISPLPKWDSIVTGSFVVFVPNLTNGTNATLTVNDIGPKPLLRGNVAISAGSMLAGVPYLCLYNGTGWEVLSSTEIPASRFLPITLDQINNRVGINKTVPTQALEVSGNIFLNEGRAILNRAAAVGHTTSGGIDFQIGGVSQATITCSGSQTLSLATAGTERIKITSAGLVGIGNVTPDRMLSIYATGSTAAAVSFRANGNPTASEFIVGQNANGTSAYVYNRANGNLDFGTNNITRLTIGNTGDVIHYNNIDGDTFHTIDNPSGGTSARSGILFGNNQGKVAGISLNGTGYNGTFDFNGPRNQVTFINSSNDGGFIFYTSPDGGGSPIRRFNVNNGGGCGFTNGGVNLSTSAITTGTGNGVKWNGIDGFLYHDGSSRLIKDNIVTCPYGLDTVLAMKPRLYLRTDFGAEEVGFIADELIETVPELVISMSKFIFTKDENDTELVPGGIHYDKLTAVLCKGIQELNQKVEELKARLDNL